MKTTRPLAWRLFATALGGRVGPRVRCNARSSMVAPHCLVWARTTIGAVGRQCRLGFFPKQRLELAEALGGSYLASIELPVRIRISRRRRPVVADLPRLA